MPSSFVKIPEIPQHWSRDRKISALLPIAKQISKKQVIHQTHTTLDRDDVYQIACSAIILAVDKYDPQREVSLVHYARKMVNWAILEAIRSHSHASRNMIQNGKAVSWVSLSKPVEGTDKTLGDVLDNSVGSSGEEMIDTISRQQDIDSIMRCIHELPEKQRDMMLYYIENDCTQKEMAKHSGFSESRAFQLMRKSIADIRKNLQIDQTIEPI